MDFTDHLYVGLRNGQCVAIAWKQEGKGADRWNARCVSEWVGKGLDVQTVHRDDAGKYWDELKQRMQRNIVEGD
jgi:hypothetical protein